MFFVIEYILNQYITQEMCNSIISENPFSARYVSDQCKGQQMCDKSVDDCLATLKFFPDWLVTSKWSRNFLPLC